MFGNYILVVVAMMIAAVGLPARADDDCYPAWGIEVFERTTVRERYWLRAAADGKAAAGERFAVQSSRIFDGICWVEVVDGWVNSKSVIPGMPPEPEPTATELDPRLPKSTMPLSELPRIEGDFWFTLHIWSGLDYLWRETPDWFWYVVDNVESIGPGPESQHYWASADPENKHVMMNEAVLYDGIQCASATVHEACHMMQFDRGDFATPFDPDEKVIRLERECYTIAREAVWDIDPDSSFANIISHFLSWTVDEWKANMIRSPDR